MSKPRTPQQKQKRAENIGDGINKKKLAVIKKRTENVNNKLTAKKPK